MAGASTPRPILKSAAAQFPLTCLIHKKSATNFSSATFWWIGVPKRACVSRRTFTIPTRKSKPPSPLSTKSCIPCPRSLSEAIHHGDTETWSEEPHRLTRIFADNDSCEVFVYFQRPGTNKSAAQLVFVFLRASVT